MSRFLSSFWGAGNQQAEEDKHGSAAADAATTGAASWITMKDPPAGSRGEPVMSVNQSTADGVLGRLGDKAPVNLVAIFGAARGGKSFLMNQLAGQDDIFKISNDKDPCTQGVDVSRAVVPLKEFATLDGCVAPRGVSGSSQVRVLFADVEGQGDRDAAYDARLASAILPLTKCVIFNWRDSLQVDRMLNLLGVMQRAAHNVDLGDDGEGTAGSKFGHLHVVFRDWNYSGTAEDVKKQLFGIDNSGFGSEVAVKNELRRTIKAAFASVTVWLFPAPVEMTSELSKELKSEDLSEGFVSQLKAFRSTLSSQLSSPTVFGPANPVTGHSLGSLVPALVEVLNKGEVIMPQSAYQQMVDMEAQQVKKTYVTKADNLIKIAIAACDNGPPVPPSDLEADMEHEIQTLLSEFEAEAKALGAKANAVAEGTKDIRDSLERGMQGLRAHNASVLGRHLKTAVKDARGAFTKEFTEASRTKMPLPPSELSAIASAASSRARGRLQAVPQAGTGDDALEEALSALGDFIELAISKAERENESLVQAQGKKEEDALAAAMESFQQDFKTDLQAVKAGGGPYQLASVEAAGKAALASAAATLRRSLCPPGDGGASATGPLHDRVAALVERLEERAKSGVLEEKSGFDRTCAAHMMKLATEERRRLREETQTDVYPLLPLYSNPELESAFRPVVQRMNDRIDSAARGWALPKQAHDQHMDSAKSDAESVWQSLFERNERLKLQRENADMGANAQRNQEEAARLRARLGEERKKAQDAETNAREASAAAAQARLAATTANQRARQAVGAREREAAAREKERREEEARRAEERQKAAAEIARVAGEAAAREAKLAAEAAAAAAAVREAEQAAERAGEEAAKAKAEAAAKAKAEAAAKAAAEAAAKSEAAAKAKAKAEAAAEAEAEAAAKAEVEAAAKAEAEEDVDGEGFEDAMDVEQEVEENGGKEDEEDVKPRRGRRKTASKLEKKEEVEEDEEESPKKKLRTSSRRKTIMTPIGKDPATLKAAREEASKKIKANQDAKAAKVSPKKEAEEEGEEGDDEDDEDESGLTEREKSRRRAAQWAKDQKVKKAQDAKKKAAAAAKAKAGGEPAAAAAATPKKRTSARKR